MQNQKLGSAHLVLLAKQAAPQASARHSASPPSPSPPAEPAAALAERPSQPPQEIVLDGRKYRLLPIEAETPPSSVPPAAPPASARPALPAVRPPLRTPLPELLTARELQIVALVAEGRANKQIAAELRISEWTVSTHLRRIYAKLDVDTRAAMVTRCFDALAVHRRQGPPDERDP
jgi:DNA-binding CsgD family transcriptional regulator